MWYFFFFFFFWGGGGWNCSSSSLPTSSGKHVVALTTSHLHPHRCRLWVFHISQDHSSPNFCISGRLNSGGLQWTSSDTGVWYVLFDMLIYPACCMPSHSFCCVFPSQQRFCHSQCISFTAFGIWEVSQDWSATDRVICCYKWAWMQYRQIIATVNCC